MNPPVPFLDLDRLHAELREPLDLAWKTVLGHGRFVNGPEVAAFETAFAGYCEAARCVGVANGTDAIELILAGLRIGAPTPSWPPPRRSRPRSARAPPP